MTRTETAYHEAGHATARYWHGIAHSTAYAFRSVSIVKDEESLGRVVHGGSGEWFRPDIDVSARSRNRIELEITTCLAGYLAAQKAGYDGAGSETDIGKAVNFASHMNGSVEASEGYLCWLTLRTVDLLNLDHVWNGVERLAAALLDQGTIRWKAARGFIDPHQ